MTWLWTPARITTAAWFDADDAATITEVSGKVSQWDDKSGNARHATQGTAANRPVVSAGGLGGKDAIDFAGSEIFLQVTRGFITNAVSAFIVYSGGSGNQRILDQRGTGAFGTVKGWHIKNFQNDPGGDLAGADDGASNWRATNVLSNFFGNAARQSGTVFPEGGELNWYNNGTLTGTNANGGSVPTDIDNTGRNIRVGGNAGGGTTQDFTGLEAEIVLLSTAASTTDRQLVEGYLAHKWGLEGSLDAGHPYKASAPLVDGPTNLQATAVGTDQINVTWDAVAGADGYEIEIDSGTPIDVGNVLAYEDTGLDPGTTRSYRVRAYAGSPQEFSDWAGPVEATTRSNVRLPALEFFSWQERVLAFASDPPATPDKGDRYIIEATATGAWAGFEDSIAWWDGDAWRIDGPFDGWVAYNLNNSTAYLYHVGWNPVLVVGFGGGVVAVSPDGSEVRVIGIDNTGAVEARVL